jgi:adenosylcobinamide-GDP ribazoletransferase
MNLFWKQIEQLFRSFASSVVFYTIFPLPIVWTGEWQRIARWATIIGAMIGSCLGGCDFLLQQLTLPNLTRSALIVSLWLGITGGLHLDGAMDTADGLATTDETKRLEVMKDSATGAFGAMTSVIILLLKTVCLSDLVNHRWQSLILAATWGRWGQLMAIALYPYLRAEGKGAFHKANLRLPEDILWSLLCLLGINLIFIWLQPQDLGQIIAVNLGYSAIALGTGYYFYFKLQGHTGDTYGAVVEWTETLILGLCVVVNSIDG